VTLKVSLDCSNSFKL